MTFATEKDKVNSERFMLIRLTGRIKYVGSSYDANTYRVIAPKKPSKVTRFRLSSGGDGGVFVELAEVASLGSMAAGKWFYDSATGYLYYNTPTGYSYYAAVDFEEFLTGGIERYYYRIPTSAGDNETWKPLVSSYPTFTQSIEDTSAGVFSISGSSFDVINEDNWADKYLVGTATFYERDCDVWIGINEQLKKVFTGTISSVSVDKKTISFSVLDKFNLMNKTATFGLPAERLTINASCSPSFATAVTRADEGKPIPRHFQGNLVYNYTGFTDIDESLFYQGFCVSYSENITSTNNRNWVCGSVKISTSSNLSFLTQSFPSTVVSVLALAGSDYFVKFSSLPTNVYAFHRVKFATGGGAARYGTVIECPLSYWASYPGASTYHMVIRVDTTAPIAGDTFSSLNAFFACVTDGATVANLAQVRDFNTSIDSTTGQVKLTFTNNFEANFSSLFGASYLDPTIHRLYYTFLCDESYLQPGETLKALVEASGLTTNATTFTDFDSAFSGYVRFSIPFFGDSSIGTYADYSSRILESCGAYLRLNESDEVELKSYAAPAPSETLTATHCSDLSTDVQFQDIYTTLESKNDHWFNNRLTSIQSDPGTARQRTDTNEEALAIFGSRRIKYLQHVLTSLTSSITNLLALNTYRRLKLRFKTATENIDTSLGDDYYIQSDNLNEGTALAVKVVSKTVSVTGTTVEAIDLHGVV